MKTFWLGIVLLVSVTACVVASDQQNNTGAGTGFLFLGDTGTGDNSQRAVAKAMKSYCRREKCEFVLLLGDNFYDSGVKSVDDPQWRTKFEDPYGELRLDFFVSLGNHDYEGNVDAQLAYSAKSPRWILPARYHDFSRGPVDFFALDTNRFDAKQAAWLNQGLTGGTGHWKIAYGHHPIYSHGHHGDSKALIKDLLPVLAGRVDFYLAGHDHDKQVLKTKPHMIVTGTGGKLRPARSGEKTLFAKSTLGFSHFIVDNDSARLRMLDVNGLVEFEKVYAKERETAVKPKVPLPKP